MDRITASEVFISIVENGSMSKASQALDMSRSMVTRYLNQMEKWAGIQLLHRSTRTLTLTSAGEEVLNQCRKMQSLATAIPKQQSYENGAVQGCIRVAASQFMAYNALKVVINTFQEKFPRVEIDLHISNQDINLIEERIDLAIRITNNLDPSTIARPLGKCHSILCASPSYLEKHGAPSSPQDLMTHNCLINTSFDKNKTWLLRHFGEDMLIPVGSSLSANESTYLMDACLRGEGISRQARGVAIPLVKTGELVEVLPDYTPVPLGVYAIYRSRKHMSPALRAFLDAVIEHFAD